MKGLFVFAISLFAMVGCALFGSAKPTPQQELTVGEYGIDLQACIMQSASAEAADACMCNVSKRYGRKDAGLCK